MCGKRRLTFVVFVLFYAQEEKPKDNSPANAFDLLGEAEA
jgi:hypothetical protein